MKKYCLLFLLIPLCTLAQTKKTNLVFILADDVGCMDLGCYGSSFYETPHLDALARDAMRFVNAYAAAAVCSPTRASILTGKYPVNTGITDYIHPNGGDDPRNWKRNTPLTPAPNKDHLALEEVTLAERLQLHGYASFMAGKWHLGGDEYAPGMQGFEQNKGGYEAGQPASWFSPYKNPQLADGPKGEYLPDRLGRETAAFIAQHKDTPFFVCHSFYLAHTPLRAKDSLIAKYERKATQEDLAPEFGLEGKTKVRLNQTLATYAAMMEALDAVVGTIVQSLKENGLYENTLIIFTSDNGGLSTTEGWPTSNAPLRAGKGWLYEGGIREPLLVRLPGVTAAGSISNTCVTSPDFYPTILDALKLPPTPGQHTDGSSFLKSLSGKKQQRKAMFWHYPQYGNQGGSPSSAIIHKQWKLISFYETSHEKHELYHLKKDIGEQHNLSSHRPGKARKLARRLDRFLQKNNALYPVTNQNYIQK